MRERITITSSTGYTKTSSGQIDASGDSTNEVYANVTKGITDIRQEINMSQNQLENAYTFQIRTGLTISKGNRITWNSNQYSIIFIGNSQKYQQFMSIIAVSSD